MRGGLMLKFRQKVAFITGAASGIGRALAELLARKGCHLALADTDGDGLQETVKRVLSSGSKVTTHELDVSRRRQVYRCADEVVQMHGGVHLVINNAGVLLCQSVEHTTYEDFEWIMGVNFWGVVYGTKAFLPYLKRHPDTHIVNISSGYGLASNRNRSAYSATKFAVRGFTEALQQELRGSHVAVSCVFPGGSRTSIARHARHYEGVDGFLDRKQFVSAFEESVRTSAKEAARIIIRGVEKNQRRILVGKDARTIDLIQRLSPERCHRILYS